MDHDAMFYVQNRGHSVQYMSTNYNFYYGENNSMKFTGKK